MKRYFGAGTALVVAELRLVVVEQSMDFRSYTSMELETMKIVVQPAAKSVEKWQSYRSASERFAKIADEKSIEVLGDKSWALVDVELDRLEQNMPEIVDLESVVVALDLVRY